MSISGSVKHTCKKRAPGGYAMTRKPAEPSPKLALVWQVNREGEKRARASGRHKLELSLGNNDIDWARAAALAIYRAHSRAHSRAHGNSWCHYHHQLRPLRTLPGVYVYTRVRGALEWPYL